MRYIVRLIIISLAVQTGISATENLNLKLTRVDTLKDFRSYVGHDFKGRLYIEIENNRSTGHNTFYQVYDFVTGKWIFDRLTDCYYFEENKYLLAISSGKNNTIEGKVYDLVNNKIIFTISAKKNLEYLQISTQKDRLYLLVDNNIVCYDLKKFKKIYEIKNDKDVIVYKDNISFLKTTDNSSSHDDVYDYMFLSVLTKKGNKTIVNVWCLKNYEDWTHTGGSEPSSWGDYVKFKEAQLVRRYESVKDNEFIGASLFKTGDESIALIISNMRKPSSSSLCECSIIYSDFRSNNKLSELEDGPIIRSQAKSPALLNINPFDFDDAYSEFHRSFLLFRITGDDWWSESSLMIGLKKNSDTKYLYNFNSIEIYPIDGGQINNIDNKYFKNSGNQISYLEEAQHPDIGFKSNYLFPNGSTAMINDTILISVVSGSIMFFCDIKNNRIVNRINVGPVKDISVGNDTIYLLTQSDESSPQVRKSFVLEYENFKNPDLAFSFWKISPYSSVKLQDGKVMKIDLIDFNDEIFSGQHLTLLGKDNYGKKRLLLFNTIERTYQESDVYPPNEQYSVEIKEDREDYNNRSYSLVQNDLKLIKSKTLFQSDTKFELLSSNNSFFVIKKENGAVSIHDIYKSDEDIGLDKAQNAFLYPNSNEVFYFTKHEIYGASLFKGFYELQTQDHTYFYDKKDITAVAVSPNKKYLVYATSDSMTNICDLKNNILLETFRVAFRPEIIKFNDEGNIFIVCGQHKYDGYSDRYPTNFTVFINENIDKNKFKTDLFLLKDEFETEEEFNARLDNGWKFYDETYNKYYSTVLDSISNNAKRVEFKIDSISIYDVEKKMYRIYFANNTNVVEMDRETAKVFKTNFSTSTINGIERFKPDLYNTEILNCELTIPGEENTIKFGFWDETVIVNEKMEEVNEEDKAEEVNDEKAEEEVKEEEENEEEAPLSNYVQVEKNPTLKIKC